MSPLFWDASAFIFVLFLIAWGIVGAFFFHKGKRS